MGGQTSILMASGASDSIHVSVKASASSRWSSIRAALPPDKELRHWVTVSMGHLCHLSRPGHRVTGSSF